MDDDSHEVLCQHSDDELGFEDDDDECITDNKWTDLLEPVYVAEFTELVGPAVPIPPSPLKVFQLFFTSVIMYFITETNRYASLCMWDEKF
uniref:PiggyBac transposable element-derived protein domain-containing protein n=1 Tax=Amphimedon queenslandica TaxID=400682 RepID=A0A1X7SWZ7_AMPQE